MMQLRVVFLLMLLFPITVFAGSTKQSTTVKTTSSVTSYEVGKDFRIISNNKVDPKLVAMITPEPGTKGQVVVTEFFNYGCPWCYRLETSLDKWLKSKPTYVKFQRIPVVFHKPWIILAKAYYVAKALDKSEQLTPALYEAVHKRKLLIKTEGDLAKVFEKAGVSKEKFTSAYNFSPEIDKDLGMSVALMRAYKVFQVPTIFINDQYKTNLGDTGGDPEKLIRIIKYLISMEHQGKKITMPKQKSIVKKSAASSITPKSAKGN